MFGTSTIKSRVFAVLTQFVVDPQLHFESAGVAHLIRGHQGWAIGQKVS
ncbi:MAG: hypothetical protein WDN69_32635 [Aliidongia sp.]